MAEARPLEEFGGQAGNRIGIRVENRSFLAMALAMHIDNRHPERLQLPRQFDRRDKGDDAIDPAGLQPAWQPGVQRPFMGKNDPVALFPGNIGNAMADPPPIGPRRLDQKRNMAKSDGCHRNPLVLERRI